MNIHIRYTHRNLHSYILEQSINYLVSTLIIARIHIAFHYTVWQMQLILKTERINEISEHLLLRVTIKWPNNI